MIVIYCISIDLYVASNKMKKNIRKIEDFIHYFLRVGTNFSTFFFSTRQISSVLLTLLSKLSSTSEKKSIVDTISYTNSFSYFYFSSDSKDFLNLLMFILYISSLSFFKQLLRAYFFSLYSSFFFTSTNTPSFSYFVF